jgi:hypothetical protein
MAGGKGQLWVTLLVLGLVMACGSAEPRSGVRPWTLDDETAAHETGMPFVYHYEEPAGGHCSNWAGATFLNVDEGRAGAWIAQFIRDPERVVVAAQGMQPFATGLTLPGDAVWTGWRDREREFWLVPDKSAAYIGSNHEWERWPASRNRVGCS